VSATELQEAGEHIVRAVHRNPATGILAVMDMLIQFICQTHTDDPGRIDLIRLMLFRQVSERIRQLDAAAVADATAIVAAPVAVATPEDHTSPTAGDATAIATIAAIVPAVPRPAWRTSPPTADEVRACRWWWNRWGDDDVPCVALLAVASDGRVHDRRDLEHDDPESKYHLHGEWSPCLPPDDDAEVAR
jgi:hypothetical protein